MQLKVRLKFNDAQRLAILDFAKTTGMQVEEFCKRAVIYAMNRAYADAEAARAKLETRVPAEGATEDGNNTTDRVDTGDSEPGLQPQQHADTAALPDQANVSDTSAEGSAQV